MYSGSVRKDEMAKFGDDTDEKRAVIVRQLMDLELVWGWVITNDPRKRFSSSHHNSWSSLVMFLACEQPRLPLGP